MPDITKIILIRHGETEVIASGKMHKYSDPEKLNKSGIKQITLAAKEINKYKVSCVYSSTEARALQSAKIISKICDIPLKSLKGIEERNWGEFSKKTWPEIQKVLEKMDLEKRYNFVPLKGESWKNSVKRTEKTIREIAKKNKGKTIAIVSHGGVIRAVTPSLLNEPKETSFQYNPPNASMSVFNFQKGKFEKELLFDTSHLTPE